MKRYLATNGGGIYADAAGIAILLDASLASNEASVDGAAIYARNGAVVSLLPSVGCPAGFFSCNEIIGSQLSTVSGRGSAAYLDGALAGSSVFASRTISPTHPATFRFVDRSCRTVEGGARENDPTWT